MYYNDTFCGGGGCFAATSLVKMANGSSKTITQI